MSKFFLKTAYNKETLNQLWMSIIADSHDICCKCEQPFAHLLDSIFPDGHKDRNLTIQQIIDRDFTECRSGGTEEENLGLASGLEREELHGDAENQEEEYIKDTELEELVAAAEDATTR